MDSKASETGEDLPPPPAVIPPNVTPLKAEPGLLKKVSKSNRVPMARPGTGRKGQMVPLLTNHFKVGFSKTDGFFNHYSVCSQSDSSSSLGFVMLSVCLLI